MTKKRRTRTRVNEDLHDDYSFLDGDEEANDEMGLDLLKKFITKCDYCLDSGEYWDGREMIKCKCNKHADND